MGSVPALEPEDDWTGCVVVAALTENNQDEHFPRSTSDKAGD